MSTSTSYLIPQVLEENTQESPLLSDLVQQLMQAHRYAVLSANSVLAAPPLHHPRFNVLFKDRAHSIAHAKFYTKGSGFGVAYCTFMSLANVCRNVIALCQDKLLPFSRILDKRGTAAASFHELALAEFRATVMAVKDACCSTLPNASNLMWSVQALMPSLAKLSGQIDNDALGRQAFISEVPHIEALPHLSQLSQIKNFNVHVNQVLTVAQSVLNVMSEWQDRLDLLLEALLTTQPDNFYEDQIQAAIGYWQGIQVTLTEHLNNQHVNKSKTILNAIPNANPYPFRAQTWLPRLTASESWA